MKKHLFTLIILLAVISQIIAQNIPAHAPVITDAEDILSVDDEQVIKDAINSALEDSGLKIEVLAINRLDGRPIDQYAQNVFNSWGLSTRSVLIVVAKEDRESRIEVGRDIAGTLTNSVCNNIMQNDIVPYFKDNDYAGGIKAGINALNNEYNNPSGGSSGSWYKNKLYWAIAVLVLISFFSRRFFRGRRGGGGSYRTRSSGGHHRSSSGGGGGSRSGGGASGKW